MTTRGKLAAGDPRRPGQATPTEPTTEQTGQRTAGTGHRYPAARGAGELHGRGGDTTGDRPSTGKSAGGKGRLKHREILL